MTEFRDPGFDTTQPTTRRPTVWPTTTETPAVRPGQRPLESVEKQALASPARPPGRSRLRLAVISAGAVLGVLGAVLIGLIFAYRWLNPPASTLMLALKLSGTSLMRRWMPLEQISPHLARAVIMSEDAGFCGHRGVDWTELERAYERGLEGSGQGGGSTLSMQVTKNLFLWPSKSYIRKAIEVPLTLAADRWWGKRRMLEIYLNIVEWGPGLFGAEAAARGYFGKSARDLTEGEAALLAVALPNPIARNAAHPSALQKRLAGVVQGRMKAGANNMRCIPPPRR